MASGGTQVMRSMDDVLQDMPRFLTEQMPSGIVVPQRGYGVCETDGTKWSAEWSRFSTGALHFTIAGGTISLAADQKIGLLTAGPGETGTTGLPYPSTDSDNDLAKTGTPIDLNMLFAIFAVCLTVDRPYTFGVVAADTKSFDDFVDPIQEKLRDLLYHQLNVQFIWTDNRCDALGGPLARYPNPGGPAGGGVIRNGAGIGIGNVMPLRRPVIAGPQNTLTQMTLQIGSGTAISIPTDPLTPPPAEATTLYVPIVAEIYGAQLSTCAVACPPDPRDYSADQLDDFQAFQDYLAARKAAGGGKMLPPGRAGGRR